MIANKLSENRVRLWAFLFPPVLLLTTTALGLFFERITGYDFQAVIRLFDQAVIASSIIIFACLICWLMSKKNKKISSNKMVVIFVVSAVGYSMYWLMLLAIMVTALVASMNFGL